MNQPWQYDENIQVGTDYRDRAAVAAYDQSMARLRNVEAEARAIAIALALPTDAEVWEIGTGTGECALALAPAVARVFASDVSPEMLACARDKAAERGIGNVQFEHGGFLSGFRPPWPVDAVVSQLALHHLPDFWKGRALTAVAAMLRSGGRFYLRDVVFPGGVDDYDAYFAAIVSALRAQAGDTVAAQTIQHIKAEYSTYDWILEGLLKRSGLRIRERSQNGFLATYVCEKSPFGPPA